MRINLPLTILFISSFLTGRSQAPSTGSNAFLKLRFEHVSGNSPLVLRDSVYATPSGDTFLLTKLKYYTTNFLLNGEMALSGDENYQLVDLAKETEYTLPVAPGKYTSLGFTLGVDSTRNCSGAQSGALDPMNDMFWTWNSGYVMFKLEGRSPVSKADRNRIEHHVGGYRFGQNVATPISFTPDEPFSLQKGDTTVLTFRMDLNKYWLSTNEISISEDPVCTLPGLLAMKIAANFKNLFTLLPPAKSEK